MQRPKPLGRSGMCQNCSTDFDYGEAMEAYANHLEALISGLRPEWLEGFKKLCDVNSGEAVLIEYDPERVKEAQLRVLAEHMAKAVDGVKLFVVRKGMTAHNLTHLKSRQEAMRIVDQLRALAFEIHDRMYSAFD